MAKHRLSKSIRKYIRKEKARIHREIFDINKQKEEIKKLYEKSVEHRQAVENQLKIKEHYAKRPQPRLSSRYH